MLKEAEAGLYESGWDCGARGGTGRVESLPGVLHSSNSWAF